MAKKNVMREAEIEENFTPKSDSKPKKKVKITKSNGNKFIQFLKDERTHKFLGFASVIFSLFLLIAFVSYFFTYKFDQSIIKDSLSNDSAANWTGRIGAKLSYKLISSLGIGAFLIIPILLLGGINLMTKVKYISFIKLYFMSFALFLWITTFFGSVFYNTSFDILGGSFGRGMFDILYDSVGIPGVVISLAGSLIVYLIFAYNMSFNFVVNLIDKIKDFKPQIISNEPTEEQNEDESGIVPANHSNMFKAEPEITEEYPNEDVDDEPIIFEEKNLDPGVEAEEKISEPAVYEDFELDTSQPEEVVHGFPEELQISDSENHAVSDEKSSGEILFDTTPNSPEAKEVKAGAEPQFVLEQVNEEAQMEIESFNEERESDDMKFGEYDHTLELSSYRLPGIELMNDYGSGGIKINKEELESNKDKIVGTLQNYSIQIDQIKATVGPTVTLYEIIPAPGVRISKIKNLEDDIALSLAALGIRIIAPIPGKGTIGIEVPNQNPETVAMKSVLSSEKFVKSDADLPIGLGKNISNETFVADLTKMPHLLMAGATGQGKSVGLNAILVSLLYKKHPSELKFVLVDPKKVELTLYNKIERHYLAKLPGEEDAIITDVKKVVATLNSLCIEMDTRYALLKDASVRTIKEYNAKFKSRKLSPTHGHRYLPYIVVVVDEFADLIMTAGKEVELPIARLAQLARAIGIHLIIATQRPSVNIITGTIKANFPARIAFRVSSKIDSRTILDSGGAEQLIGRGDMLFSTGNDLIRLQCAFVDTPEVEKLTEFIGQQRGYPSALELPEYVGDESDKSADFDINDRDPLFEDAARTLVQTQQGSTSMLQRRMKLGYNRAGRLMDQLEAAGIVGPNEGSKARQVLFNDIESLERFLNSSR
jgi:S-DNA-T family DNA segregation ATPase FtsK/SpoIIIE